MSKEPTSPIQEGKVFQYTVLFVAEKIDDNRRFETNDFKYAEQLFWTIASQAKEILGDWKLTLVRNAVQANDSIGTLLVWEKTY